MGADWQAVSAASPRSSLMFFLCLKTHLDAPEQQADRTSCFYKSAHTDDDQLIDTFDQQPLAATAQQQLWSFFFLPSSVLFFSQHKEPVDALIVFTCCNSFLCSCWHQINVSIFWLVPLVVVKLCVYLTNNAVSAVSSMHVNTLSAFKSKYCFPVLTTQAEVSF